MIETFKLLTLDHAVEIGTTLTGSWFRGHSQQHPEPLVPKVYRSEYQNPFQKEAGIGNRERTLFESFKNTAPGLVEKTPLDHQNAQWLALMQHHGVPTRLLDWTESILVALYFAVRRDHEKPSELWCMSPLELNRYSIGGALPMAGEPHLVFLVNEPFEEGKEYAKRLGLEEIPDHPLAHKPLASTQRVIAQHSTFTIHPPPPRGVPIEQVLTEGKYLCRYVIPPESKPDMLEALHALGYSERALFCDLEALGRTLVDSLRTVAYFPPDPPECGGSV